MNKIFKAFLNHQMWVMIVNPSLQQLLGSYPASFVVTELPHVVFCATVSVQGYDSVDAVTKVSTRVVPDSFKVLISNCVQHPKSE